MQTGQHPDTAPQDGSLSQMACYALNYFLAQLYGAGIAAHKKHENREDFTLNLKSERLSGTACSVALSDDHRTIILEIGDETWRAAATIEASWCSDQTSNRVSASHMANIILNHLSERKADQ